VFIVHFLIADTHIPAGDVSGTWTIDGSPYIVDGYVIVPVDSTLMIESGVLIFFSTNNGLRVKGQLISEGSENDSIVFNVQDTSNNTGIGFYHTDTTNQDSSIVSYSIFEHVGVHFDKSSNILFQKSRVSKCMDYGGVYFDEDSCPTLMDVTISNNNTYSYGGGIYCTDGSCPRLVNVNVIGNSASWGGGIACRFDSNPILENVTIMNNFSESGAGMFCAESSPVLNNVLIAENEGSGFCCTDGSSPVLDNVVISKNVNGIYSENSSLALTNIVITGNDGDGGACFGSYDGTDTILMKNFEITGNINEDFNGGGVGVGGVTMIMVNGIIADNYAFDVGGIYAESAQLGLKNVTICDNTIDDWGNVGGIGLNYYCKLDMTNCILWNNELNEIAYMGPGCAWNIDYSNIEDGISSGTGNISINPLFADTLYHLSEESPCIDAGNPDTTYYDIEDPDNPGFALYPAMGTLHNDMGAYGGHGKYIFDPPQSVDDPHNLQSIVIHNYPNPFTSSTVIYYTLPQNIREAQIEIYNIKGQKIKELSVNNNQSSVVWNAEGLASGLYFCKLTADKKETITKMVLMR